MLSPFKTFSRTVRPVGVGGGPEVNPVGFIPPVADQVEPEFTAGGFTPDISLPRGYLPLEGVGSPVEDLSLRHLIQQLEDHMDALDHLVPDYPNPRVSVALLPDRDLPGDLVVGGVGFHLPDIVFHPGGP